MARNLITSCNHADDEEFIDIEVNSSTTYLCYSISSPPSTREFEFQMSSASLEKEPITSPADELFYQGKLLPLHLPPRLQMVQKLLQNSSNNNNPPNVTNSTPNTDIPFESPFITLSHCNSSQLVSNSISDDHTINKYFSWPKKLKLIKRSTALASKLRASPAYLKSLFRKSGRSDQASVQPHNNNACEVTGSKAKERLNKYMKVAKQHPLIGQLQREIDSGSITSSSSSSYRRSFSSGVKEMQSGIKSSSFSSLSISPSSSSPSSLTLSGGSSNGLLSEVHFLRRSNSTNSEIEGAIQGAIAHCKQSSATADQES